MRAVSRTLYDALRGGGAVIEGAEFLLAHHDIPRRQIPNLMAAASCALIAAWLGAWLTAVIPAAPVLSLPWQLVFVEWLWASLPAALAAALTAWIAQTAYVALALPRQLVWAVMEHRGVTRVSHRNANERSAALVWLGAGGAGCGGLAYLPVVGPVAAAVLICPVIGAGLMVMTLTLCGWPRGVGLSFVWSRWALLTGLGLGVTISLAIPVLNLVALPCAAAGTTSLLLREPRPQRVRTNEETVPCASPDR